MGEIVIVGGGVGGTVAANVLARELAAELAEGQVRIRLLTDRPDHVYKPAFLGLAFGRTGMPAFQRPLAELLHPQIDLIVDPVQRVEPAKKTVLTKGGQTYPYDQLVLAVGTRLVPERTPGFVEAAEQPYTAEGARRLYRRLDEFRTGRVVVSVIGLPHMCPLAPLEIVFLLDSFFKERGRRQDVELVYTYPTEQIHFGPPIVKWAAPKLAARNILTETLVDVARIDAQQKMLVTKGGATLPFDLLIGIPEHAVPSFLESSGLTKDGWVPTDPYTLQVEGFEGVYALGDVTDLPLSKSGSVAHFQAATVAANLAAQVRGLPATRRYDGKMFCFIETGKGLATYIKADYNHPPRLPRSSQWIYWAKLAYTESYWLTAKGVL